MTAQGWALLIGWPLGGLLLYAGLLRWSPSFRAEMLTPTDGICDHYAVLFIFMAIFPLVVCICAVVLVLWVAGHIALWLGGC